MLCLACQRQQAYEKSIEDTPGAQKNQAMQNLIREKDYTKIN